jgi:hypothetical protein
LLSFVACAAMLSERRKTGSPGVLAAYIDPGSGALALQLLASVLVGLLFYVKRLRHFLARTWARFWDRKSG